MLGRNVLVGLFSSLWSAALGFAVIPVYLKYLGVEAYGLIGFFATAQAMFQLLDMGLAPTINREVARRAAEHKLAEVGELLHTLAVVYWALAALIAVIALAMAPLIAGHWLHANQLSSKTLQHAVMLLGIVIACRWPIGLYQGVLMGAQRISTSSMINVVMSTLASLGAATILSQVAPTIEVFFAWQAMVGLAQALLMRRAAWRAVGRSSGRLFRLVELKKIWRFSASMGGIALLGLIFTQLDKMILSRVLNLTEFGRYMLASVVVSGLYIVVSPLFNALYPRFTSMVAANDDEGVSNLYRISTRALGCILFPLAMVLVLFSGDIVRLWTGDAAIANAIAPVIALLAVGSALHGVMHVPHAMQLAYGETRLPLAINSILVVIQVPLIIALALSLGATGGALAWLILHILYVGVGSWLTHRRLLVGQRREWLLHDVGIPLFVSLATGAAVAGVSAALSITPVGRALLCIAAFATAVMTTLVFSPLLRDVLAAHLPRRLRAGVEPGRHRPTFGWEAKK